MPDILHILNGDATAYSFADTGLNGDVLVWREIFSQGPLSEDITSTSFWNARQHWLAETFNEKPEDVKGHVFDPLNKLKTFYPEINLWFEFDLHCQANLLGVLSLLRQNNSSSEIYLICPGEYPGKDNFKGMGELNAEELLYLFNTIRVKLDDNDLQIAAKAWELYVKGSVDELNQWIEANENWGALTLLKPALQAHLGRLKTNDIGLNYIEQKLLDIYETGLRSKHDIYQEFWKTEKIYGMGDAEIDLYLKKLEDKKLMII